VQLLDKSVGAGSDFFQKDYKMLHDTVRPFRTETVQLPGITGRTEKTFQLWGLSGKPLPGSAPRSFLRSGRNYCKRISERKNSFF
jgi:hypothetical protein